MLSASLSAHLLVATAFTMPTGVGFYKRHSSWKQARSKVVLASNPKEEELNCWFRPKPQIEYTMTKKDAINKLQSLQRNDEGSDVHAEADTVLCDFLDAVGYGEIAREFRKIHEMYPTVTPRLSKSSWRL